MEYMNEDIQERIREWSRVKDNIFPVLVPGKKEQLNEAVWRSWQDLAVCYVVRLPQGGGYLQHLIIKQMLEEWGIKQPDMHEQAMENMFRDGYRVARVREVLTDLISSTRGPDGLDEFVERMMPDKRKSLYGLDDMDEMLVISNRIMSYGASVVLDGGFLKRVAGKRDMYILPSSRHEMLLLPAKKGIRKKDLENMVQGMNRDHVLMEDRLSDSVYYYNARKGRVEM